MLNHRGTGGTLAPVKKGVLFTLFSIVVTAHWYMQI